MNKVELTMKVKSKGDRYTLDIPKWADQSIQDVLQTCIDSRGGFVTMKLSRPGAKRSTGYKSQNHHFNGHIQCIAIQTGIPFEMVKIFIKNLALGRGYPIMLNTSGDPVIDFAGNTMGKTEADATSEECAILIESVHQFADENGLELQEDFDE